jgi:hypothetical protein
MGVATCAWDAAVRTSGMFVLPETDKKVDIHCGVAAMSACADLSFNHNMSLVKRTATSVLAETAASRGFTP